MSTVLSDRLDQLETDLPDLPAKTVAFGRATARRTTSVATAVIGEISAAAGTLAGATSTAARTVYGQARSAADRSAQQVRTGINEVRGQAAAQVRHVGDVAYGEAEDLLDDATETVAPEPSGRAELEALTKSELTERARQLDIDGRSSMTKDELVDAIASN